MLLMTDGTVLVHQDNASRWDKLVPDRHGSYVNGGWRRIAPLPGGYSPLYFSSAVLPDGRVVVLGGEYDGGNDQVESNRGALYNPRTNAWRDLPSPPWWTHVGDAQSTVLADGRLLVANLDGSDAALLNPRTLTWTPTGTGKFDQNGEEGWALMPDGRVLTVDTENRGSELYDPATGAWSSAGTVPVSLVDADSEQGPLVSGPDGSTFVVGATGHTAIYHSAPRSRGRWSRGPNLPRFFGRQYVGADSAGARLPDGKVFFDASPPHYGSPTHFFLLAGDGRRLQGVEDNGTARRASAYNTRMLVLPNGDVLYDDSIRLYVFRHKGAPRASWRPRIGSVRRHLVRGRAYQLSGRQLAGRDQGAAYGDDFQDNTNYPLIRVVHGRSKKLTYARTFSWSSVSTAPGARSKTKFTLPRSTPLGRSRLVVVANGIASKPVTVTVLR
jgi:hypothetical protein